MSLHIIDGRPVSDAEWFAEHDSMADDARPWPEFRPSDRYIGCPDDFDGDDLPALLRRQAE